MKWSYIKAVTQLVMMIFKTHKSQTSNYAVCKKKMQNYIIMQML